MFGLPLADPQFWIVTLAAAAIVAWGVRRWRSALRGGTKPGCDRCAPAERARRGKGLLLAVAALAAPARAGEPVERVVAAMGAELAVRIEGLERAEALALSERIVEAVERTEAALSTWRGTSELAALNRQPLGAPMPLSAATWKALAEAVRCSQETGGAFDPTVGPLVAAWDLRGAGRVPEPAEIEAARARVGLAGLGLDRPARSATRLADVVIEEGGFGKGAALEAALAVARETAATAAVRLDFGGQLAWIGLVRPLELEIADPRDRARAVLTVDTGLVEGSASTSAGSERDRMVDGVRIGHLLDPRTGRPAPGFGSATTIALQPTLADCRSTGISVLGPEAGRARVGAAPSQGDNLLVVVEGERLRALVPARLRGSVAALVPDLEIEFVGRGSP